MIQNKINTVSIVVSVYNEEESIASFFDTTTKILSQQNDKNFELIFVNDGSKDKSQEILNTLIEKAGFSNIRFKTIEFSTNFGHEAAMIAGIDYSDADAIICMDADLQHPPEYIEKIINKFEKGYDIVNMVRKKRKDNGFFKNFLSGTFYKIMNKVSDYSFDKNSSDFFGITKQIAEILKTNFRERNRFLRGYIQIIGFNKTTIEFTAPKRFAGESKYSYRRLMSLASIALLSFSKKPLYFALLVSLFFILFTFVISVYSIYMYFWGDNPPSGYTTLIIFMSIGFSLMFVLIAILSLYIGRSYDEIKERPIYLVKNSRIKK